MPLHGYSQFKFSHNTLVQRQFDELIGDQYITRDGVLVYVDGEYYGGLLYQLCLTRPTRLQCFVARMKKAFNVGLILLYDAA